MRTAHTIQLATKQGKVLDDAHQSVGIGNPQCLVLCSVSTLPWDQHIKVLKNLHCISECVCRTALHCRGRRDDLQYQVAPPTTHLWQAGPCVPWLWLPAGTDSPVLPLQRDQQSLGAEGKGERTHQSGGGRSHVGETAAAVWPLASSPPAGAPGQRRSEPAAPSHLPGCPTVGESEVVTPPTAGTLTPLHLILHVWNMLIPVFLIKIKVSIPIAMVTRPHYLQNFTVDEIVHLLL